MKYRHRLRPLFGGYENNCLSTTVDPFVPEFAAVKARSEAGASVSHIDADYDGSNNVLDNWSLKSTHSFPVHNYTYAIDRILSLIITHHAVPFRNYTNPSLRNP
ncbi:hypothetical protein CDAR_320181 [Caerostris darwini]|uniref:Uncharacterized protein n=1 Tax=Caerostris darwini TaxID=1538125 RepID=A0AAV4NKY4_9ARAC|nr:hypothetical protein CDAR_320181 [Caerostris darwini]